MNNVESVHQAHLKSIPHGLLFIPCNRKCWSEGSVLVSCHELLHISLGGVDSSAHEIDSAVLASQLVVLWKHIVSRLMILSKEEKNGRLGKIQLFVIQKLKGIQRGSILSIAVVIIKTLVFRPVVGMLHFRAGSGSIRRIRSANFVCDFR